MIGGENGLSPCPGLIGFGRAFLMQPYRVNSYLEIVN